MAGAFGFALSIGDRHRHLRDLFINKLIQGMGDDAWNTTSSWRWMMGIEAPPGVGLHRFVFTVLRAPRWLMQRGRRRGISSPGLAEPMPASCNAIRQASLEEGGRLPNYSPPPFRSPDRRAAHGRLAVLRHQRDQAYYSTKILTRRCHQRRCLASSAWIGLVNLLFTFAATVCR